MTYPSFGRALAAWALCGLVSSGAVAAAAPSPAEIMALSKSQYEQLVKERAKIRGAAHSVQGDVQYDNAGPVVTRLDLAPLVDANRSDAQIVYSYAAKDDLSGVRWLGFVLRGPSGQERTTFVGLGMPRTKVSGRGAMFPGYTMQAGDWRVTEVRGEDQAHNLFQVPPDLDALGNMNVAVKNDRAYDAKAPKLISGQILTPVVSLSTPPKGQAYGGPLIGASVELADVGSAGVNQIGLTFCLDKWTCKSTNFLDNELLGAKRLTLQPYVQVEEDSSLGVYELKEIYLSDLAGNYTTLTSVLFGGSTDFSQYFPSTTIELKP
ncbi:hypothetical protein [Ideonella sp.]|uniref:hypothetical protein n=1 Tax=Ideonella sp. TaxID=1929293 RepID=UPI0035B09D90